MIVIIIVMCENVFYARNEVSRVFKQYDVVFHRFRMKQKNNKNKNSGFNEFGFVLSHK